MYNIRNNLKPLFRGFFCFKVQLLGLFLLTNLFLFSQEKLIITRDVQFSEIEIISDGLDDIVIENATDNQITIMLLDENPNTHTIFFDDDSNGNLKVGFKLNFNTYQEPVFRKYITTRLQRARAIVKIPMDKNVTIHGKTIGVISNSYQGNLKIYIDKGNVRFNVVNGNTLVSLFLGNVYAQLLKKTNINIETNNGEIHINKKRVKNHLYKVTDKKAVYNLNIRSVNANVFLITE